MEAPVTIIVPSLQMGELLLFLKYLYSNKVEQMFNKEDVGVIENVCQILQIDLDMKVLENQQQENDEMPQPQPSSADSEIKDDKIFRERRLRELGKLKTKISCKFCQEVFPFSLLGKHVKLKHPEQENCCLVCETQCSTRTELEEHIQQHRPDNIYYLSCERCDRVVLSQYQLQMHKKSHNIKNLASLPCPHCDKTFQIKDKLNKHIELHQSGRLDRKFPCDQCDKVFSKQYDLGRHIKSHSGVKTHFCDVCGDRFVDGTRLKQHKWIHANHKGLKCPMCEQSFRMRSHLNSHLASFHPASAQIQDKLLECSLCRRRFAFAYKLKQHLEWHNLDQVGRVESDTTEYNILNMNIVDSVDQTS